MNGRNVLLNSFFLVITQPWYILLICKVRNVNVDLGIFTHSELKYLVAVLLYSVAFRPFQIDLSSVLELVSSSSFFFKYSTVMANHYLV